MKIITSQYIYEKGSWNYRGYLCNIDVETEPDVRKAYYEVKTPQGQTVGADLNPYDGSRKIVEMWIDAGMPAREGHTPWDKERLAQKLQGGPNTLSFVNYYDLKKESQSIEPPHRGILPPKSNNTEWLTNQDVCGRCKKSKPDVRARNSFGIYAGKYCNDCAYKGYRDHCGLVRHPNGSYSEGKQGDTRVLEEMGEQIEPLD